MKNTLLLISFLIVCCSCSNTLNDIKVSNSNELNAAIENAKPGDNIVLANGVWKDLQIKFIGEGTENQPITIKAETPGQVIIEGVSDLKFGGEYLVVDGLYFKNGYSPSDAVIEFRIDKKTIANHCAFTNSVIEILIK